jgi:hypothetical protein
MQAYQKPMLHNVLTTHRKHTPLYLFAFSLHPFCHPPRLFGCLVQKLVFLPLFSFVSKKERILGFDYIRNTLSNMNKTLRTCLIIALFQSSLASIQHTLSGIFVGYNATTDV